MTTPKDKDLVDTIFSQGILEGISLGINLEDPKVISVCLEAMSNILQHGKDFYMNDVLII